MSRVGIVVPSSNTTAEPEFCAALPDDCTLHAARMPLEDVTAEDLDAMADGAERAASLLSHASVDGIAYACTTGSLIHGPGFDADLESRLSDITENQGESLALQGGDESDNSPTFHRLIARQDIPHCANIHTIN